jgi:chromosome segregation ATPase
MENLRFANDSLLEQHEDDTLELQSLAEERDGLTQELQLVTTAQVDQVDQVMQTQMDQLTAERDNLTASAACFEDKFETHRRLLEQAQKEVCRMQEEEAQWETKVAEQNAQIKNLLETNSDVEMKYEELKDTNDGMIEEAATAHDQIKQLEAKIMRNLESIQQLTKENGGLRYTPHKGVRDSDEMYELKETLLAVEKSESARLQQVLDQRVGELTQIKKRFESSQVKLVRLASELLQSQGEAKVHRDSSLGLTTEKQALQAKLDQHQAAAKRTLERSSTLQRDLSASEGALKVPPALRSFDSLSFSFSFSFSFSSS